MSERGDAQAPKGRVVLENLKRIRQPVTWAVLAILCAGQLLGVVRVVLLVFPGQTPVFEAFQEISDSIMSLSLVIVLAGLVCACLFVPPAAGNAIRLAKLSAWAIAVGALLQLVCLLMGVAASANVFGVIMEILGGLLDVVLKAVAAGVVGVLVRGVRSGRLDLAPAVPEVAAPEKPRTPPVWQPEQASGTAWRSARDAASGARPDIGATPTGDATDQPELTSAPEPTPETRWRPRATPGDQGQ
ncbi:MAG: hypothetical protein QM619_15770 [Micropruina sp.]|uniref:hypothetical protein n=1 Tax=Micropruina sp. TaxID=2737536 RepID=UPI0039E37B1B